MPIEKLQNELNPNKNLPTSDRDNITPPAGSFTDERGQGMSVDPNRATETERRTGIIRTLTPAPHAPGPQSNMNNITPSAKAPIKEPAPPINKKEVKIYDKFGRSPAPSSFGSQTRSPAKTKEIEAVISRKQYPSIETTDRGHYTRTTEEIAEEAETQAEKQRIQTEISLQTRKASREAAAFLVPGKGQKEAATFIEQSPFGFAYSLSSSVMNPDARNFGFSHSEEVFKDTAAGVVGYPAQFVTETSTILVAPISKRDPRTGEVIVTPGEYNISDVVFKGDWAGVAAYGAGTALTFATMEAGAKAAGAGISKFGKGIKSGIRQGEIKAGAVRARIQKAAGMEKPLFSDPTVKAVQDYYFGSKEPVRMNYGTKKFQRIIKNQAPTVDISARKSIHGIKKAYATREISFVDFLSEKQMIGKEMSSGKFRLIKNPKAEMKQVRKAFVLREQELFNKKKIYKGVEGRTFKDIRENRGLSSFREFNKETPTYKEIIKDYQTTTPRDIGYRAGKKAKDIRKLMRKEFRLTTEEIKTRPRPDTLTKKPTQKMIENRGTKAGQTILEKPKEFTFTITDKQTTKKLRLTKQRIMTEQKTPLKTLQEGTPKVKNIRGKMKFVLFSPKIQRGDIKLSDASKTKNAFIQRAPQKLKLNQSPTQEIGFDNSVFGKLSSPPIKRVLTKDELKPGTAVYNNFFVPLSPITSKTSKIRKPPGAIFDFSPGPAGKFNFNWWGMKKTRWKKNPILDIGGR